MSQFVNHSKTRFVSIYLWKNTTKASYEGANKVIFLTHCSCWPHCMCFCLSKLKRLVYTMQFIYCYCLRYKQKNNHEVWQTDRNLKIIDWWIQEGNKYKEMWLASLAVQPAVYRCTKKSPQKTRPWHPTAEKNIKERKTHSICGSLSFSRLSFNVTFH